jgi:hypothetical protein
LSDPLDKPTPKRVDPLLWKVLERRSEKAREGGRRSYQRTTIPPAAFLEPHYLLPYRDPSSSLPSYRDHLKEGREDEMSRDQRVPSKAFISSRVIFETRTNSVAKHCCRSLNLLARSSLINSGEQRSE